MVDDKILYNFSYRIIDSNYRCIIYIKILLCIKLYKKDYCTYSNQDTNMATL